MAKIRLDDTSNATENLFKVPIVIKSMTIGLWVIITLAHKVYLSLRNRHKSKINVYCDYCRKEETCSIVEREETYNVKGENITIQAKVCVCNKCKKELWVSEIDNNNLNKAYKLYEKKHKSATPAESKATLSKK